VTKKWNTPWTLKTDSEQHVAKLEKRIDDLRSGKLKPRRNMEPTAAGIITEAEFDGG